MDWSSRELWSRGEKVVNCLVDKQRADLFERESEPDSTWSLFGTRSGSAFLFNCQVDIAYSGTTKCVRFIDITYPFSGVYEGAHTYIVD